MMVEHRPTVEVVEASHRYESRCFQVCVQTVVATRVAPAGTLVSIFSLRCNASAVMRLSCLEGGRRKINISLVLNIW